MEAVMRWNEDLCLWFPWKQIVESFVLALFCTGLFIAVTSQDIECKEYNIHETADMSVTEIEKNVDQPQRNVFEDVLPNLDEAKNVETGKCFPEMKVKDKQMTLGAGMKASISNERTEPDEQSPSVPAVMDSTSDTVLENGKDNTFGEAMVPWVPELTVIFHGNGGIPERMEVNCEMEKFHLTDFEVPKRLGKVFDGWFIDKACTIPFTEIAEGNTKLEIYAGWKEIPGFRSNDKGHIIGYTDASIVVVDNLVVLPHLESCTGLASGAFDDLKDKIFEIYIPANITYIEPEALNVLSELMYIQVDEDNPAYYSEGGILYTSLGELVAVPGGW